MKTILFTILFGAIFLISWEIQKFDYLLGHTVGIVALLITGVFLIDHLAKKIL
jgi:hypothetical protein